MEREQIDLWAATSGLDLEESKRLIKYSGKVSRKRKQVDKTRLRLVGSLAQLRNQHQRDALEHKLKADELKAQSDAMMALSAQAASGASTQTVPQLLAAMRTDETNVVARPPRRRRLNAPRLSQASYVAQPQAAAAPIAAPATPLMLEYHPDPEEDEEPGNAPYAPVHGNDEIPELQTDNENSDDETDDPAETDQNTTSEGIPADASPDTSLAAAMRSATIASLPPTSPPRAEGAPARAQSPAVMSSETPAARAMFDNMTPVTITAAEAKTLCTGCREPFRVGQNARTGPNCVRKGEGGATEPADHLMHEACALGQFEHGFKAFNMHPSDRDRAYPNWRSLYKCNVCRQVLTRKPTSSSSTSAMDTTSA